MLTRQTMQGLYVLVVTPFHEDLTLDEAALRENARVLVDAGVNGIIANGTNGEFHTTTDEERRRIIRILVEECGSKAVAVAGASGVNTAESIERTRTAAGEGAQAVMNVLPYYHILTKPEAYRYFEELSAACPDIGVIIYNNPVTTQVMLNDDDLVRLQDVPTICGTKMIGSDIALYMNCLRRTQMPHFPLENMWGISHIVGGTGVMASFIYAFPGFMMRWWKAITSRDDKTALAMQHDCNRLLGELVIPLITKEGYNEIAATKAVVDAVGILKAGPPRRPFRAIPAARIEQLRQDIRQQFPQFVEEAR